MADQTTDNLLVPEEGVNHKKSPTPSIDMNLVSEANKKLDENEITENPNTGEQNIITEALKIVVNETSENTKPEQPKVSNEERQRVKNKLISVAQIHKETFSKEEIKEIEIDKAINKERVSRTIPCLQVIDQDGIFSDEKPNSETFDQFVAKNAQFKALGFNYNMLSILGPQNSGKSTLLNYLFDTNFAVLDEKKGRQRTTRGVWLGVVGDRDDIMVMDLEGSDGSSREDDYSFERKISLFSLTVCSVLMVNIWSHDVGRYGASNMSLLKNIFELNLQLFQKEDSPKTMILFVVRDRDQRKSFDSTKKVLCDDIAKIWDGVVRPECFKRAPITKFFDLEFTSLPHFKHNKEQFIQEVNLLRSRFDSRNKDTFFKSIYNKEIPADGLSVFTKQVWEAIKKNKDLDLPSQKEMLARYRCDELITLVLKEFEEDIQPVVASHEMKKMFPNFKQYIDMSFDKRMKEFMATASKYLDRVVKEKADALSAQMINVASSAYQTQMILSINYIKTMLSTSYFTFQASYTNEQNLTFDPNRYAGYADQIEALNTAIREEWRKISSQSVPTNVENTFTVEINNMDKFIGKMYEIARKGLVEALMNHFKRHMQKVMRPKLFPVFENCADDMWAQVRKIVDEATKENLTQLENGMINSLKMERNDVEEKLAQLQVYVIDAVRSTIKERSGFVNSLMETRFLNIFRNEKDGLPHKWKANEDLSKPFFAAKKEAEKILDLFSYIRIDTKDDEVSFLGTNPATNKTMVLEEPEKNIESTKGLFSFDERLAMFQNFQNTAEAAFTKAQQDQAAVTIHSKTPMWLILLIVFLGFDNIVQLFKSPVMMAVVLVIIGIVFAMTRMGYSNVIDSALSFMFSVSWSSVLYLAQDLGIFSTLLPKPEVPTRKGSTKPVEKVEKPKSVNTTTKPANPMGNVTSENIDSIQSFDEAFKMVGESD
ncbi:protein SEY1, putative [Entamoeba invadens IP1]|uniref:Protein SEY1 homolog n=1 Tax=Entamoeba invadens IP1 TaxID=370355 RepID=A0A0A1UC35_ENTIV|nr:protein SEY1, putative [Entamoeba invadens IP1]ELP92800.1 protein SEY1, putative [Entamoeba invadens IP1]|eukprot:XP_004259571.1 protein SEY1, putative [Entamoeba invadens IP1]